MTRRGVSKCLAEYAHADTMEGANRSAPGVGELNRGLALRGVSTKGVPVESTQNQQDRRTYRAVVAPSGAC